MSYGESEKESGDKRDAFVRNREISITKAVCAICGKDTETRLFVRDIRRADDCYDVYFCEQCRIGFTDPFPSSAVLSRLYASGSYRSADGTRFNVVLEFLVRFFTAGKARMIRKFHGSKGALLDIGCGRGLFLDFMKNNGWRVTGVEFNEETASYARTVYRIDVITPQEMMVLPDESYDVITLYHVLEHVPNLTAVLRTCGRLLKKHGLLVIAVPNMSSLQARMGKSNWFHLDIPYHLHHFTLSGLRQLLEGESLNIVRVSHVDFEQNIFGWLQTLLNASGIKYNLMYSLLKKPELRRSEFAAAGRKDILFTIFLTPIYLPLSVMLSLVESLVLRRGGTMHLYASKQ